MILQEYADLVFEGMTLAGKAIGAKEGILFLRGEYTYLKPQLEETLQRRRAQNLLGKNVLGADIAFDIRIFMGAGGLYLR